jgi:geranylgeranyl pyrophosphate synthase
MTEAQTTRAFFAKTDRATINKILDNVAKHYGITRADAMAEVLDDEAESLLDYVTGPERAATSLLMKRHGLRAA